MGRKSKYDIPEDKHKLNKDRCLCPGGETCKNGNRCHYEGSDGTISICRNQKKKGTNTDLCETCKYVKNRSVNVLGNVEENVGIVKIKQEKGDLSQEQVDQTMLFGELCFFIGTGQCEALNRRINENLQKKICLLAFGQDELFEKDMTDRMRSKLCEIVMSVPPGGKDIDLLWKRARTMLETKYKNVVIEWEERMYEDTQEIYEPNQENKEKSRIQQRESSGKNVQSTTLQESPNEDEKSDQEQMLEDSSDEEGGSTEKSAEKSAENSISEENLISEEKSAEMEISEENLLSPDPLVTRAPRARKETARERNKREKEEKKAREAARIKSKEEEQEEFKRDQKRQKKAYAEAVRLANKRKRDASSNEEEEIPWEEAHEVGFLIDDFAAKKNEAAHVDSLIGAIVCGYYYRYQKFAGVRKLARTKGIDNLFGANVLNKVVMENIVKELKKLMIEEAVALIHINNEREVKFFRDNDVRFYLLDPEQTVNRIRNIFQNNGNFGEGNTTLLLNKILGLDIMLVQRMGKENVYKRQLFQYPVLRHEILEMTVTKIKMNESSIMLILAHNVQKDNYNHLEPMTSVKKNVSSSK